MRVTFTWHNASQDTVWNRLAQRLGREPTAAEARAEALRILSEARCDLASEGKLPFQRKR